MAKYFQSKDMGTIKKLKAAFRKLCMTHHPDKGGEEEAFKELMAEYESLIEWRKKKDGEEDEF